MNPQHLLGRTVLANILIVDDEPSIRLFLSGLVERMGHHPVEAENGQDALEKFKKQSVDLAIVDVHMPEMNGIQFLEEAKKVDPLSVVIMMTGYPSAETIIQTIEDDGYTYIAKPLEIDRMTDLIERGLVFRRTRHQSK
jgi:DNA-binding NtrC family response regulator